MHLQLQLLNVMSWSKDMKKEKGKLKSMLLNQLMVIQDLWRRTARCGQFECPVDPSSLPRRRSRSTFPYI